MFIENCKNLSISGVTLTNSAFWTVHLVGCDGVNIDSVKILNNRRMLNADGIDPDHSKNIVINNCYIESADDCIAIKNTLKFVKKDPSFILEEIINTKQTEDIINRIALNLRLIYKCRFGQNVIAYA